MRHIPNRELLHALRESLRDLDNLKLLSPSDLEILDLRRSLKNQIAALEGQQSQAQVNDTEQSSDWQIAA